MCPRTLCATRWLPGPKTTCTARPPIIWAKKDQQHHHLVNISFSNRKELVFQLLFFAGFYVVIYITLKFLQGSFGVIPWADALASAAAFTGMWLMARKKVESWYWWMATNIASIPLYFVKDFKLTSLYYLILLIMAVFGLREWQRRAREHDYKEFLPET